MGIIDGDFGDGKTLFLVAIAVECHEKYKHVYANFHLKNIPNFVFLDKINKPILLNLEPNSLLLVTESYYWLDRRYCMKKENIKTSQALMQIRKTKIDQYYDVFKASFLDFRAVDFTNFFIRAKGEIGNGYYAYIPLRYNKETMRFHECNNALKVKDMSRYYDYYDTYEITEKDNLLSNYMKN